MRLSPVAVDTTGVGPRDSVLTTAGLPSPSKEPRSRHHQSALVVDSEVPPHARRNHILTGYRPIVQTDQSLIRASFRGLFSLHNETLNVWSHLLGVGWAVMRLQWLTTLPADAVGATAPEGMRMSVGLFLLTAIFCLGISVIAHLLAPIVNREPSLALWRVDSFGICVLIGGSYLPGLAFGFRCRPAWRGAYSTIVGVLLLAGALTSVTAETGRGGTLERLRVCTLCSSVLFGLVPLCHFCMLAPSDETAIFVPPLLHMFFFYILGFFFYASAVPESLNPGRWDLRGGSHFMWHLAVLSAVVAYERGVQAMLLHKDAQACEGWPPDI